MMCLVHCVKIWIKYDHVYYNFSKPNSEIAMIHGLKWINMNGIMIKLDRTCNDLIQPNLTIWYDQTYVIISCANFSH